MFVVLNKTTKTMKRVAVIQINDWTTEQIKFYVEAIYHLRGIKSDLTPYRITSRYANSELLLGILINNNKAEVSLFSYQDLQGYSRDGYQIQILKDYNELSEFIKEDLKYY